jgi:hypothetical protein
MCVGIITAGGEGSISRARRLLRFLLRGAGFESLKYHHIAPAIRAIKRIIVTKQPMPSFMPDFRMPNIF